MTRECVPWPTRPRVGSFVCSFVRAFARDTRARARRTRDVGEGARERARDETRDARERGETRREETRGRALVFPHV